MEWNLEAGAYMEQEPSNILIPRGRQSSESCGSLLVKGELEYSSKGRIVEQGAI